MKPRTKTEKEIVRMSGELPKLSLSDENYINKRYCASIYRSSLKTDKHYCLHCGSSFEHHGTDSELVCPVCHKKLQVEVTRKRTKNECGYVCFATVKEGWQVLRYVWCFMECRISNQRSFYARECIQRWIAPDGRAYTMALPAKPFSMYSTYPFAYDGELSIKETQRKYMYYDLYDVSACVKIKRVIPELKRCGFRTFKGRSPFYTIIKLLENPKRQTLYKNRLYWLAVEMTEVDLEKYWCSVKQVLRRGYRIKDESLWVDMLRALDYCGKDIHNSYYVCPTDLKYSHDRWVRYKERLEADKKLRELKEKAVEYEQTYASSKGKYLGIVLCNGDIDISVLPDVQSFAYEGESMKHCVFTNKYFLHDCLILSARRNGDRLATIELSIKDFHIVQCRGRCNSVPDDYDEICALIQNNLSVFRKAKRSKQAA